MGPSCCMEFRPTIYAWLILFFVVFPLIYISGRVMCCVVWVLFRVLRGLFKFLIQFFHDDEADMDDLTEDVVAEEVEYDEPRTTELDEQSQESLETDVSEIEGATTIPLNGAPRGNGTPLLRHRFS